MPTTILGRLTSICLALPETSRIEQGRHAKFVVRAKTFAYYLDDHHGDGIIGAAFKAPWGENTDRAQAFPALFYVPQYIGPKGWVGVKLDAADVDWDEVREMAITSYSLVAPKKLAALAREP